MQDILSQLPRGTTPVVNFIFGHARIKQGIALPTLDDVPSGTNLLLNLEPATEDEDNPLAPGVRIGEDLWELGTALRECQARGITPWLNYSAVELEKAYRLLSTQKEHAQFIQNVAEVVIAEQVPHRFVTDGYDDLRILQRYWRERVGPMADVFFMSQAQSVVQANVYDFTGPEGGGYGTRQKKPGYMHNVDNLLVRLSPRAIADPVKRPNAIATAAKALDRARTTFGVERGAVLLGAESLGLIVANAQVHTPA